MVQYRPIPVIQRYPMSRTKPLIRDRLMGRDTAKQNMQILSPESRFNNGPRRTAGKLCIDKHGNLSNLGNWSETGYQVSDSSDDHEYCLIGSTRELDSHVTSTRACEYSCLNTCKSTSLHLWRARVLASTCGKTPYAYIYMLFFFPVSFLCCTSPRSHLQHSLPYVIKKSVHIFRVVYHKMRL